MNATTAPDLRSLSRRLDHCTRQASLAYSAAPRQRRQRHRQELAELRRWARVWRLMAGDPLLRCAAGDWGPHRVARRIGQARRLTEALAALREEADAR